MTWVRFPSTRTQRMPAPGHGATPAIDSRMSAARAGYAAARVFSKETASSRVAMVDRSTSMRSTRGPAALGLVDRAPMDVLPNDSAFARAQRICCFETSKLRMEFRRHQDALNRVGHHQINDA